jgi:hypothetical protein
MQKLGFQYIWIDWYCISQRNKGHADTQIQQIDAIITTLRLVLLLPLERIENMDSQAEAADAESLNSILRSATTFLPTHCRVCWILLSALFSRRSILFSGEQAYKII